MSSEKSVANQKNPNPTRPVRALQKIIPPVFKKGSPEYKLAEHTIQKHFDFRKLKKRGVEVAKMRCCSVKPKQYITSNVLYHRPTGWHGEGGNSGDNRTGHITVDFITANGVHVTTQHVYRNDSDYNQGAGSAERQREPEQRGQEIPRPASGGHEPMMEIGF